MEKQQQHSNLIYSMLSGQGWYRSSMYLLVTAIHTALLVTQPTFWTFNSSHFFRRKLKCILFAYCKTALGIFQKRSLRKQWQELPLWTTSPWRLLGFLDSHTVIHLRTSSSWSPATWSKRQSRKRLVIPTCIATAPLSSRVLLHKMPYKHKARHFFQLKSSLFKQSDRQNSILPTLERGNWGRRYYLLSERLNKYEFLKFTSPSNCETASFQHPASCKPAFCQALGLCFRVWKRWLLHLEEQKAQW